MLKKLTYILLVCAVATLVACGDNNDGNNDDGNNDNNDTPTQQEQILALTGDAAAGEGLYASNCLGCHGEDGQGGSFDKTVTDFSDEAVVSIVLSGKSPMPSYKDTLSNQEIADILAHINTL